MSRLAIEMDRLAREVDHIQEILSPVLISTNPVLPTDQVIALQHFDYTSQVLRDISAVARLIAPIMGGDPELNVAHMLGQVRLNALAQRIVCGSDGELGSQQSKDCEIL